MIPTLQLLQYAAADAAVSRHLRDRMTASQHPQQLRCCSIILALQLLQHPGAAAAAGPLTVSFMEPHSILNCYAAAASSQPCSCCDTLLQLPLLLLCLAVYVIG
jgi:hypothetical protein